MCGGGCWRYLLAGGSAAEGGPNKWCRVEYRGQSSSTHWGKASCMAQTSSDLSPPVTREPGRAPPRHAHGDLTPLAPHERLPEILVVPRASTLEAARPAVLGVALESLQGLRDLT